MSKGGGEFNNIAKIVHFSIIFLNVENYYSTLLWSQIVYLNYLELLCADFFQVISVADF